MNQNRRTFSDKNIKHVLIILCKVYWNPGSSELFLDLVKKLTGSALSSDAWVHELNQDTEELIKTEKDEYEKAVASGAPKGDVEEKNKNSY